MLIAAAQAAASPAPSTMPVATMPAIVTDACNDDATTGEIVVCADRQGKRYRLPEPSPRFDPRGSELSVARERAQWIEQGDTGIQSCSAVGPGGWTGCAIQQWKRDRQQKGWYQ